MKSELSNHSGTLIGLSNFDLCLVTKEIERLLEIDIPQPNKERDKKEYVTSILKTCENRLAKMTFEEHHAFTLQIDGYYNQAGLGGNRYEACMNCLRHMFAAFQFN